MTIRVFKTLTSHSVLSGELDALRLNAGAYPND